jgi:hypothetical protein
MRKLVATVALATTLMIALVAGTATASAFNTDFYSSKDRLTQIGHADQRDIYRRSKKVGYVEPAPDGPREIIKRNDGVNAGYAAEVGSQWQCFANGSRGLLGEVHQNLSYWEIYDYKGDWLGWGAGAEDGGFQSCAALVLEVFGYIRK